MTGMTPGTAINFMGLMGECSQFHAALIQATGTGLCPSIANHGHLVNNNVNF